MILDNTGCYLKSFQVECVCKLHPAQRYCMAHMVQKTPGKNKNTYDVHVAKPRRCSSVRHMQKNKEGG